MQYAREPAAIIKPLKWLVARLSEAAGIDYVEKMEELHKLETVDIGELRSSTSRLQKRLAAGRDPGLLAELVDGYFAKGSKRVLKILTSLKEVQSQVGIEMRLCVNI